MKQRAAAGAPAALIAKKISETAKTRSVRRQIGDKKDLGDANSGILAALVSY